MPVHLRKLENGNILLYNPHWETFQRMATSLGNELNDLEQKQDYKNKGFVRKSSLRSFFSSAERNINNARDSINAEITGIWSTIKRFLETIIETRYFPENMVQQFRPTAQLIASQKPGRKRIRSGLELFNLFERSMWLVAPIWLTSEGKVIPQDYNINGPSRACPTLLVPLGFTFEAFSVLADSHHSESLPSLRTSMSDAQTHNSTPPASQRARLEPVSPVVDLRVDFVLWNKRIELANWQLHYGLDSVKGQLIDNSLAVVGINAQQAPNHFFLWSQSLPKQISDLERHLRDPRVEESEKELIECHLFPFLQECNAMLNVFVSSPVYQSSSAASGVFTQAPTTAAEFDGSTLSADRGQTGHPGFSAYDLPAVPVNLQRSGSLYQEARSVYTNTTGPFTGNPEHRYGHTSGSPRSNAWSGGPSTVPARPDSPSRLTSGQPGPSIQR